jgi:hypothetical protein
MQPWMAARLICAFFKDERKKQTKKTARDEPRRGYRFRGVE